MEADYSKKLTSDVYSGYKRGTLTSVQRAAILAHELSGIAGGVILHWDMRRVLQNGRWY
jgi:hypothetical protein